MSDLDLERILELREVVRRSSDPNAFAFLRGMEEARWAIVEAEGVPGAVVGMVGAIPLGKIGILCHLAVRHDYRKMGLGVRLSSWAVSYLRSRGAEVVRLDATHRAEALYRSLGFELTSRRVTYRLEGATLSTGAGCAVAKPTVERECLEYNAARVRRSARALRRGRWSFGADR
jgi:ribosomal protein S18 acetylase RimI-like enzyme